MSSPMTISDAADGEIVDGAAVVLGVDDGRRFGGEPGQILADGQAGDVDVGRQEGLERDRRRDLAAADQAARKLVDLLMDRLEEVLRLEEVRDAVERLVVDEDGAQQRLLRLDIVRRRAEQRRGRPPRACEQSIRRPWCLPVFVCVQRSGRIDTCTQPNSPTPHDSCTTRWQTCEYTDRAPAKWESPFALSPLITAEDFVLDMSRRKRLTPPRMVAC